MDPYDVTTQGDEGQDTLAEYDSFNLLGDQQECSEQNQSVQMAVFHATVVGLYDVDEVESSFSRLFTGGCGLGDLPSAIDAAGMFPKTGLIDRKGYSAGKGDYSPNRAADPILRSACDDIQEPDLNVLVLGVFSGGPLSTVYNSLKYKGKHISSLVAVTDQTDVGDLYTHLEDLKHNEDCPVLSSYVSKVKDLTQKSNYDSLLRKMRGIKGEQFYFHMVYVPFDAMNFSEGARKSIVDTFSSQSVIIKTYYDALLMSASVSNIMFNAVGLSDRGRYVTETGGKFYHTSPPPSLQPTSTVSTQGLIKDVTSLYKFKFPFKGPGRANHMGVQIYYPIPKAELIPPDLQDLEMSCLRTPTKEEVGLVNRAKDLVDNAVPLTIPLLAQWNGETFVKPKEDGVLAVVIANFDGSWYMLVDPRNQTCCQVQGEGKVPKEHVFYQYEMEVSQENKLTRVLMVNNNHRTPLTFAQQQRLVVGGWFEKTYARHDEFERINAWCENRIGEGLIITNSMTARSAYKGAGASKYVKYEGNDIDILCDEIVRTYNIKTKDHIRDRPDKDTTNSAAFIQKLRQSVDIQGLMLVLPTMGKIRPSVEQLKRDLMSDISTSVILGSTDLSVNHVTYEPYASQIKELLDEHVVHAPSLFLEDDDDYNTLDIDEKRGRFILLDAA